MLHLNYGQGWGEVSHSAHILEVAFPDFVSDEVIQTIYDALKNFEWFNAFPHNKIAMAVPETSLDGTKYIRFDAKGLFGKLARVVNGKWVPVRIWSQRVTCLVTGDTAGTHMLVGQRRWKCQLKNSQTVIISTESYDQPRGRLNWLGLKLMGQQRQLEVWHWYLKNIASHLERYHGTIVSLNVDLTDVPGDNPWPLTQPYPGVEIL
jgi:hypothetical protein